MNIDRACTGVAVAIALLAAGAALGDSVYKWTDEKGEVHYTEMPPTLPAGKDARVQRISPTEQELARTREEGQRAEREAEDRDAQRDAELAALQNDALPPVPGETAIRAEDQRAVLLLLVPLDAQADPDCFRHQVRDTKRTGPGGTSTATVERWTLDRCGQAIDYEVTATPLPDGSSRLSVTRR